MLQILYKEIYICEENENEAKFRKMLSFYIPQNYYEIKEPDLLVNVYIIPKLDMLA